MRITMIGAGYVGLVSGACLSEFGFDVTCVDRDEGKIETLLAGDIPIFEPGLDALVKSNREAGRLHFTTDLAQSVGSCDVVFIAVGTPTRRGDGAADVVFVEQAAKEIAENLDGFTLIVTKSTVPVGTARSIEKIVREVNPGADFEVASNPEFLREGSAIEDFMRPDRIVVGTDAERAKSVMAQIYRPLSLRNAPIVFTGLETAELTKYAGNAFLATKITFINQIADLCEAYNANVQEVAHGIGLDGRIGGKFLHPGPGFGGSCFPKDVRALSAMARDANICLSLVDATSEVNETRKVNMADRIVAALGGNAEGKRIGVLGLSFKPNTDDMREAPALDIVPRLVKAGADVHAYDPAAMDEAAKVLTGITWENDTYDVARDADVLVILTEWNEFRALDMQKLADVMKQPLLVDLRNVYSLEEMAQTPFVYHSIGRPSVQPDTASSQ